MGRTVVLKRLSDISSCPIKGSTAKIFTIWTRLPVHASRKYHGLHGFPWKMAFQNSLRGYNSSSRDLISHIRVSPSSRPPARFAYIHSPMTMSSRTLDSCAILFQYHLSSTCWRVVVFQEVRGLDPCVLERLKNSWHCFWGVKCICRNLKKFPEQRLPITEGTPLPVCTSLRLAMCSV